MPRLILVCGPTGAGKTTYAISLSEEAKAIRFSIDPWMQTLFASDMMFNFMEPKFEVPDQHELKHGLDVNV
jgi:predicted kinase